MTDEEMEEMAEEYVKSVIDVNAFDWKIVREIYLANFEGLKVGRPKWHKLREKYPEADKLVRVRLMSGMEHICETCYYEPTEDEIGYGKLVINFYELNGEWVDDNAIIAWCEIPKFKE